MLQTIVNLDLLSVGIAIASITILGFAVFSSNRKSITNKTFLYFSLVTIFWGIANYIARKITLPETGLWVFRMSMFFAVWQAFFIFKLFYVFPKENLRMPRWYQIIVLPLTIITSLIALTPLVLTKVTQLAPSGQIEKIKNGPGITLFGLVALGLVLLALIYFLFKISKAKAHEKTQFSLVLLGAAITFVLLIIFNFILPAFFDNPRFIPLGSLFILPFIAFTFYAIVRYKLLNVKVIATEILTLILAIATFSEIVLAENITQVIFRAAVFITVLGIGVLLIRSVRIEVRQREKLETLTKNLEATNEKLKKLDKLKSEFLSFASHDLKSPINVIKQFATLIHDGTYSDREKIKETSLKIKNTAIRAVTMVNNFLDIRKIEEGKMEYNFEKKNIVEFVKGISSDFLLIAKQKGIESLFESKAKDISVLIDTDKMRQVIQNLLDNALKYTKSGTISTTLTEEQSSVLISIKDSGLGISKEIISTLFEQFHRDPGVSKKIQGTGLGLFISKQIVLAHHGEIWAESEGEGNGSTFYVRLKRNK